MPLIEARELTKSFRQADKEPGLAGSVKHLFVRKYKTKVAVDRIDLSIEPGESIAYLGPNGAGKSTTIKMLSGILVPTSGDLRVDGLVPFEQRQRNARNVGVVFGQRTQLWWDIPVVESFALARDMYEIPPETYRSNLAEFSEMLGLAEFMNLPAARISLGQRMRADLCMALLHNPKILYLDEPTIGLDIAVKDRIRSFVRRLVEERGTTVMLTTHDLGDIEDICQRIVIIDQGRIIHDGDLRKLIDTYAQERVIRFEFALSTGPLDALLPKVREALPQTTVDVTEDCCLSVRFDRFAFAAGEIAAAVMRLAEVADFQIDEPAVEDVIKRVYLGQLGGELAAERKLRAGSAPETATEPAPETRPETRTETAPAPEGRRGGFEPASDPEAAEEAETAAEAAAAGATHHP